VSAFIQERKADFGVEPICQTLGVSASAYYQRASGERSDRAVADERLLTEIRRVHEANYECYGSRRVWKALLREGTSVARCTVERLMSINGIQGAKRRGKPWRTTTPAGAGSSVDLVERDFTAPAPNRLWVADFTYLRCWEGAIFFAFIIDVFSRMIVGWQLACHMRDDLVLDALRMALGLRGPGAELALVHHSDRGSQYTSEDYTQALDDHLVLASLGSTGDCYDNALAESFVDSFKTELISDRVWRTHAQAELAIVEWVAWFNHDRLHSSLGDIPPVEFEHHYAVRQLAGAVEPARSSTATPAENSVAPNGSRPLAIARPPMEMTSYGQPADGSRDGLLAGLPTGLGQPAAGSRDFGLLSGLPTFPQALRLSSIKQNNITTKEPT
jgi:putative transposase